MFNAQEADAFEKELKEIRQQLETLADDEVRATVAMFIRWVSNLNDGLLTKGLQDFIDECKKARPHLIAEIDGVITQFLRVKR